MPFCNPSFDSLPSGLHFFLIGCQPFSRIIVHRLPVIFPTEYMYKKYAHYGSSQADIYAEVARDVYCKTFGLQKSNISLVEKNKLSDYLYDFTKPKLD